MSSVHKRQRLEPSNRSPHDIPSPLASYIEKEVTTLQQAYLQVLNAEKAVKKLVDLQNEDKLPKSVHISLSLELPKEEQASYSDKWEKTLRQCSEELAFGIILPARRDALQRVQTDYKLQQKEIVVGVQKIIQDLPRVSNEDLYNRCCKVIDQSIQEMEFTIDLNRKIRSVKQQQLDEKRQQRRMQAEEEMDLEPREVTVERMVQDALKKHSLDKKKKNPKTLKPKPTGRPHPKPKPTDGRSHPKPTVGQGQKKPRTNNPKKSIPKPKPKPGGKQGNGRRRRESGV